MEGNTDTENTERNRNDEFININPEILYFGTPVVLVSTVDKNGNINLAPISSAWALGYSVVLGIGTESKTMENLKETGECTLSFPEGTLWKSIEKLAPLTGKYPVPADKAEKFRYESDKFSAAGLIPSPSEIVKPPGVRECRLQMEAFVKNIHPLSDLNVKAGIIEVKVVRVHADRNLIIGEKYVNAKDWNPLIYSFRHYFSLGTELGKTFRSRI
ncbi:MAG: flavin reductase family protein [Thermoplasmata archaeon]